MSVACQLRLRQQAAPEVVAVELCSHA